MEVTGDGVRVARRRSRAAAGRRLRRHVRLVNVDGADADVGTELLFRYRARQFTAWSRTAGRARPRSTGHRRAARCAADAAPAASFTVMWEVEDRGRAGRRRPTTPAARRSTRIRTGSPAVPTSCSARWRARFGGSVCLLNIENLARCPPDPGRSAGAAGAPRRWPLDRRRLGAAGWTGHQRRHSRDILGLPGTAGLKACTTTDDLIRTITGTGGLKASTATATMSTSPCCRSADLEVCHWRSTAACRAG